MPAVADTYLLVPFCSIIVLLDVSFGYIYILKRIEGLEFCGVLSVLPRQANKLRLLSLSVCSCTASHLYPPAINFSYADVAFFTGTLSLIAGSLSGLFA
jgi:hypothetical protein